MHKNKEEVLNKITTEFSLTQIFLGVMINTTKKQSNRLLFGELL